MNYEEKYKQAFERAKERYSVCSAPALLEYIFPELKESEDEQIRKTLIDYFQAYKEQKECGITTFYGISTDNILTWLEKQGEQQGKSALEAWRDMRLEVYQQASGNRHEPNYSDDRTKMFSLEDIDEIIEKISEQTHAELGQSEVTKTSDQELSDEVEPKFKPGDTMRTWREAANGYTDGMPVVVSIDNEYYHCTNELIAIKDQDIYEFPPINMKQKSLDEVEPKFKVGDIVQYITDSTDRRKIEEIDTLCNMYHTDSSPIMFEIEDEWKVVVNAEDVEQESVDKVDFEKKELKKIESKTLDPDKVIAWLVGNICDFEYYVKRFKQDFGL